VIFQGFVLLEKYFRAELKLKKVSLLEMSKFYQIFSLNEQVLPIFFFKQANFTIFFRRRQLTQAARHLTFDLMK